MAKTWSGGELSNSAGRVDIGTTSLESNLKLIEELKINFSVWASLCSYAQGSKGIVLSVVLFASNFAVKIDELEDKKSIWIDLTNILSE